MELKQEIGERLRKVREHYTENQKEFAKRLGSTQGLVSKYERGDLSLPDEIKFVLLQIGVSGDWLITGKGSMFIIPSTLGKRLEETRRTAGHDQKGFANLLGVDLKEYQSWEADQEEPPREKLQKIEKITGRDYRWILTGQAVRADNSNGVLTDFERAFPDVHNVWKQWGEFNLRLNGFYRIEPYYKELDDKAKELVETYTKGLFDAQKDK